MTAQEAELEETRQFVRALASFANNYRKMPARTTPEALRAAATRVEEALTECMRAAVLKLHAGNRDQRTLAASGATEGLW